MPTTEASSYPRRYTVSRWRPFNLRALSTLRPDRVLMRTLKPCVFARFRTFGCQVRLGMMDNSFA